MTNPDYASIVDSWSQNVTGERRVHGRRLPMDKEGDIVTKPLEFASTDQEILETVAEGGRNFTESHYLPTISKVLTALTRKVLHLERANKPRSVPISERAMSVYSWEAIKDLNDLDFLVATANRGATARYFDFDAYMKKFAPIIARTLLTNQVQAQPYPPNQDSCCKCGRSSFHDKVQCRDKMEW